MKFQRSVVLAVTLCVLTLGSFSAQSEAQIGKWIVRTPVPKTGSAYLKIAFKVNKVTVVTKWEQLGKLVRFGSEETKQTQPIRDALKAKKVKIVLVNVSLRNDLPTPMTLGYYGDLNTGSESVTDAFRIWVRGEEGTELGGGDNLSFADGSQNAAMHLTYFLANGLPKGAAVPPKGVVTGTVAYVVKDWFVPGKVFTRRYSDGLPDLGASAK